MRQALKVKHLQWQQRRKLEKMYKSHENKRTRERAHMILLSYGGQTPQQIGKTLLTSDDRVRDAINRFLTGGCAGLEEGERSGRPPKISNEMEAKLRDWVLATPEEQSVQRSYWTTESLAKSLKKEFRVKVTDECVRMHLLGMNLVCRRPTWTVKPLAKQQPGYARKKIISKAS
jgi:putative transposase